jgi:hypothetical protein
MTTHGKIQKFVQRHHGFIPKPEWINHVKVVWGPDAPGRRTAPGGVVAWCHCRPKNVRRSNRPFGISV